MGLLERVKRLPNSSSLPSQPTQDSSTAVQLPLPDSSLSPLSFRRISRSRHSTPSSSLSNSPAPEDASSAKSSLRRKLSTLASGLLSPPTSPPQPSQTTHNPEATPPRASLLIPRAPEHSDSELSPSVPESTAHPSDEVSPEMDPPIVSVLATPLIVTRPPSVVSTDLTPPLNEPPPTNPAPSLGGLFANQQFLRGRSRSLHFSPGHRRTPSQVSTNATEPPLLNQPLPDELKSELALVGDSTETLAPGEASSPDETHVGSGATSSVEVVPPGLNSLTSTPEITFAPEERNAVFHADYPDIDPTERLIEEYTCALQDMVLVQGKIYVSEHNVCFKGWAGNITIKFDDIIHIEKKKAALVIDNSLEIETKTSRYFLASFIFTRDECFTLLSMLWDAHVAPWSRFRKFPDLRYLQCICGAGDDYWNGSCETCYLRRRNDEHLQQSRPSVSSNASPIPPPTPSQPVTLPRAKKVNPAAGIGAAMAAATAAATLVPNAAAFVAPPSSAANLSPGRTRTSSWNAFLRKPKFAETASARSTEDIKDELSNVESAGEEENPLVSEDDHIHSDPPPSGHTKPRSHRPPSLVVTSSRGRRFSHVGPSSRSARASSVPTYAKKPAVECKCSIPGTFKRVLEESYDGSFGYVVKLMFGDGGAFLANHFRERGLKDVLMSPWSVDGTGELVSVEEKGREGKGWEIEIEEFKVGMKRKVQYTMALSGPIGPKSTRCLMTEQVVEVDPKGFVCIASSAESLDVAESTGFIFQNLTRTCISHDGPGKTRLKAYVGIEFVKVNFMVQGIIRTTAIDGMTTSYKELSAAVRKHLSTVPDPLLPLLRADRPRRRLSHDSRKRKASVAPQSPVASTPPPPTTALLSSLRTIASQWMLFLTLASFLMGLLNALMLWRVVNIVARDVDVGRVGGAVVGLREEDVSDVVLETLERVVGRMRREVDGKRKGRGKWVVAPVIVEAGEKENFVPEKRGDVMNDLAER
ncbi:hypothetical protein BJ742DRAFT_858308 [Cladochytrium replicatum]|nr:hypothetical protein BJ742DRAFT_858308 [Cladochytrium replicatum]